MANYTLIPSSLTGGEYILDASNAYSDTNSTSYASSAVKLSTPAFLGGFNFSAIPSDEVITSLSIKIKINISNRAAELAVYSSTSGTPLSSSVYLNTSSSPSIVTFTLTEGIETILSYAETLCIRVINDSNAYTSKLQIYGAEIDIETVEIGGYNKVIYDGNTLIDLTSDTITAADVLSGITFHLPNGAHGIGEYLPPCEIETGTWSPTSSFTFSGSTPFSKTHSEPPTIVAAIQDRTSATTETYLGYIAIDYSKVATSVIPMNVFRFGMSTGQHQAASLAYYYTKLDDFTTCATATDIKFPKLSSSSASSISWKQTYSWIAIWL